MSSEEKCGAQSAQAPALPEGWEWEHYDDGSHAVARGVRVACQGGLVRVVGDYEDVVDAPIAVVLAVIARNVGRSE